MTTTPTVPTGPTSARPTVRFLVHGSERSGPPVYMVRLLRAWSRRDPGFETEVVLGRPGPLLDELRLLAPTSVARLDRRSPEKLAARALRVAHLDGVARRVVDSATSARVGRTAVDLTVVNGATAPTAALLRAVPSGPTVMIAHELSTGWFANIDAADRQLFLDRCSRFLAVSEAVRSLLVDLGVADAHITVVPPPIDPTEGDGASRHLHRREDEVVVAGGGVTDWRKAPELWLQVAAEVRRLAPDRPVRFVWFGGSTPDERTAWPLRHEIAHLGLDDDVEFLGEVPDPWAVLAGADVFASTAREDAAPLVCAEAAAAGLPVVTFDSGGAAELVRDGRCGRVIPYPRVDEFASALAALVRDRTCRIELGARGASFVADERGAALVADRVGAWLMEPRS